MPTTTSPPPANPGGNSSSPIINDNPAIQSYYTLLESRIGYRLILGGTRHYAYWDDDTYFPLPLGPALRRMESELLATLDLPRGSHVLDAGCGVGHVALFMAREGGLRVRAIDIVDHHVAKTRRNVREAFAQGRGQSLVVPGQITVDKMDYHHLESIPDASLEGVYTMETLVHATDPEAVMQGFLRVLKPGGHVAFYEYDQCFGGGEDGGEGKARDSEKRGGEGGGAVAGNTNNTSTDSWLANDMRKVNELAAMPTYQRSSPGYFRELLEDAGFEHVVVKDLSHNVRPMLRLFYYLAIVPYLIVSLLGLQRYFPNTIAGVLGYAAGDQCHYLAISARKPGELEIGKAR